MLQRNLKALFLALLVWAKRTATSSLAALFRFFSILFHIKRPRPHPDLSKPAAPSHYTPKPTTCLHSSSSQSQAPKSPGPEATPYIACSNVPKSAQAQAQNATQSPSLSPTQSTKRQKSRPLPPSRRTRTLATSIDSASFTNSPPVSPTLGPVHNSSLVYIKRRQTPLRLGLVNNGNGNSSLGHGHGPSQTRSQNQNQNQTQAQAQILDFNLNDSEDAYANIILDPEGRPISIYTSEPNEIDMSPVLGFEASQHQQQLQQGVAVGSSEAPSHDLRTIRGPRPMPTGGNDVLEGPGPHNSSPTQSQMYSLVGQTIEAFQPQRDPCENSPGVSGPYPTPAIPVVENAGAGSANSPNANTVAGPESAQEAESPVNEIKEMGTFQPSSSKRYDRNVVITNENGPWTFPPLVSLSLDEDDETQPWMRYTQPEGQPYFVNPSRSREICFVTEADMYELKSREEVERFVVQFEEKYEAFKAAFYEKLERRRSPGHSRENSASVLGADTGASALTAPANPARVSNMLAQGQPQPPMNSPVQEKEEEEEEDPTLAVSSLPTNIEVVLEIDDGEWKYYMVDLDRRMIFWIDPHDADESAFPPHFGVQFREHFRHNFISEFWTHVEVFPCHRMLISGAVDELMGLLLQMHIDLTTSKTSTACFDRDELNDLMSTARHIQKLEHSRKARQYVVCGCARLMALLYSERFVNFWGFPGARLSNNQSVRGTHPRSFSPNAILKRGLLFRVLSPLLFLAPEHFMRKIEDIYVDKIIKVRPWRKFIERMEAAFTEYILYSTVLLNANVAYLSIPTVESNQDFPNFWMGASSVVSTCSIITSLGSIIIGLLLVRQQRAGGQYAEEAVEFVQSRSHPTRGVEMLAILYSLPYALLLWGMALFFGSVALTCFTVTANINTHLTRAVYGALWGFVLSLILVTVANANDGGILGLVGVIFHNNFIVRGLKKLTTLRVHWPSTADGKGGDGDVELEGSSGRGVGRGGIGGILNGRGGGGKKHRPSLRNIIPTLTFIPVSPSSSPTDETLAESQQNQTGNGDFPTTPTSSIPLNTLHPSSNSNSNQLLHPSSNTHSHTRRQQDQDAETRSVRSSHSRFTTNTNTAVSSSSGQGGARTAVGRAVRKATGGAKRKLTMLMPGYGFSFGYGASASPSASTGGGEMTAAGTAATLAGRTRSEQYDV